MTVGQVVYSKRGRDRGMVFIVVGEEGEFVFLADGRLRRLSKPKKKKLMHVQPTNTVLTDVQAALSRPEKITDAEIVKALAPFKRADGGKNKGVDNLV